MKYLIMVLLLILIGCDGSSKSVSNVQGLLDDMAGQGGVCDNVYYSELRGNYDGQIRYFSTQATCLWEVDMQVSTTLSVDSGLCRTAVTMTSELLSGDVICGDIGIGAPMMEPFYENQINGGRNTVTWPIDALVDVTAELEIGKVYPVGQSGQITVLTLQFDGVGNVTYPVSTSTEESFTGVLVKN